MGLNEALFVGAAAFALLCATAVVFVRHTVYAALFFVAHLGAVAVLYALLNAPLIAALQIMVYGGAVMVLFLFAIMILDSNELEKLKEGGEAKSFLWGGAAFTLLLAAFFGMANRFNLSAVLAPGSDKGPALSLDNVKQVARSLYGEHLFAFELVGVLLLVAVVGILVMAKRRLD